MNKQLLFSAAIVASLGLVEANAYAPDAPAKAAVAAKASATEPEDMTSRIANADCESGLTGWSHSKDDRSDNVNQKDWGTVNGGWTNGDASIKNGLELYCNSNNALVNAKLWQDLEGLPAGKYKLSAAINAVQQGTYSGSNSGGTYLYANAGGNDVQTAASTANAVPQTYSVEIEVANKLTIGFKTESTTHNWIAIDNFKLQYLGGATAILIGQAVTDAEALVKAGGADMKSLEEAITKAKAVTAETTQEELDAAAKALAEAYCNVVADKATLASLSSLMAVVKPKAESHDVAYYPKVADLKTALTECGKVVDDLDVKSVATKLASLKQAALAAFGSFTVKGVDMTSSITNPSFENKANGWTGGNSVSGNQFEFYQTTYDFSQALTVPNGDYAVVAQGYQRPGGGWSDAAYKAHLDGTEEISAYLYANSQQTKLKSLYDEFHLTKVSNEQEFEGVYYSNNLTASKEDFDTHGLYNNVVGVTVTDGKLTIGAKGTKTASGYWSCFGGFKLYAQSFAYSEGAQNTVVAAQGIGATMDRTFVAGQWNTLCVPFGISAEQLKEAFGEGTLLREFASQSGNTLNFKAVEAVEAGKAYLIKPVKTAQKLSFDNVTVVAGEPASVSGQYGLQGIYSPKAIATDGTNLFVGEGNRLYQPSTGDQTQLKGLRAYFVVPADADAKSLVLNLDGETTGIEAVNGATASDGKVYDLRGHLVGRSLDGAPKGLYIVNGKKAIKK